MSADEQLAAYRAEVAAYLGDCVRTAHAEGATPDELSELLRSATYGIPPLARVAWAVIGFAERRRLEAIVRELTGAPEPRHGLWRDPRWLAIVKAYKDCGGRPTELAVAERMGWRTEQTLRTRLTDLGLRWTEVHDLIAADRSESR